MEKPCSNDSVGVNWYPCHLILKSCCSYTRVQWGDIYWNNMELRKENPEKYYNIGDEIAR